MAYNRDPYHQGMGRQPQYDQGPGYNRPYPRPQDTRGGNWQGYGDHPGSRQGPNGYEARDYSPQSRNPWTGDRNQQYGDVGYGPSEWQNNRPEPANGYSKPNQWTDGGYGAPQRQYDQSNGAREYDQNAGYASQNSHQPVVSPGYGAREQGGWQNNQQSERNQQSTRPSTSHTQQSPASSYSLPHRQKPEQSYSNFENDRRRPPDSQMAPSSPKKVVAPLDLKSDQRKPIPRILEDKTSPDTMAWDSPFPIFPTTSQKNGSRPGTPVGGNGTVNRGLDGKGDPSVQFSSGSTINGASAQMAQISFNDASQRPPGNSYPPQRSENQNGYHQGPSEVPAPSNQSAWPARDQSSNFGAESRPEQATSSIGHYQGQARFDAQPNQYSQYQEEEMPNFDAISPVANQHQAVLESHLQQNPRLQGSLPPTPSTAYPHSPNAPYGPGYNAADIPRSQSQPSFGGRPSAPYQRDPYGSGPVSPVDRRPATSDDLYGGPYHQPRGYDRPPPNGYGRPPIDPRNMRGPPPHGRHPDSRGMRPGGPPGPNGRPPMDRMRGPPGPNGRPSPPHMGGMGAGPMKPPNPDALPKHPAPVRPGLNQGLNGGRPPPVRNYNGPPSHPVDRPNTDDKNTSSRPVTMQELEDLRQRTLRNPNNDQLQLKLAQKLIDAADVLIDDRADAATKKRNRDRFQADALKIIKKLSSLNIAEADFMYADLYSRGALGLPADIKEAFLLYQKAAKANHPQAAYRVAVCCEIGQEEGGGTKRDPVKAMQWYKRAATLGDTAAMYKLGVIELKGLLGQPRDVRDAMSWLRKAADKADAENPHALHELGLLYERATDGVRKDDQQAYQLFLQAANLGYKFSQFKLGCCFEYALLGCQTDPRQSIAWYSKAAVQEEHQSELALSGWYLTGAEGVLAQSDTEAYLWARKSAQSGLAKAEYAMGYFTEVGIGAPANMEDAKRWYWKSASQNFPKARERLEDLRRGNAPKKARVSRSNMRKQSDGDCVVM